MSPNKGGTAVHGCHCPGDMAVRMREVLVRLWVSVCVPLALSLSYKNPCTISVYKSYGRSYGLTNSLLAMTYKSSHILIPEMPDSIKFQ